MADKKELNLEEMENVTGGGDDTFTQGDNKNTKSTQQTTKKGNNTNELTQINDVHHNKGNVTINAPINLKNAKNSTINIGM